MDAKAKSIIYGLNFENGPEDLYAALIEGISYDGYRNLQILNNCGIKINKLRATGGGSRSPKWLQLKADLFDMEIGTIKTKEAGALGCIMLAAASTGIYKNISEAFENMIELSDTYYPNKARGDKFRELYVKQSRLYDSLKNLE